MDALRGYGSSDEDEGKLPNNLSGSKIDFAPKVELSYGDGKSKVEVARAKPIPEGTLVLHHNARASAMWTQEVGPSNPYKKHQAGISETNVDAVSFDQQFHARRDALGETGVHVKNQPRKREREKIELGDEDTHGIWAKSTGLEEENEEYVEAVDEETGEKIGETISEEQKKYLEEIQEQRERSKQRRLEEEKEAGEAITGEKLEKRTSTQYFGGPQLDYLGRSWIDPPSDLKPIVDPEDPNPDPSYAAQHTAYIPKKHIHTWKGHTRGVQVIEFSPYYGHLLLSGSMDATCKIWDVYKENKGLKRSYNGHTATVRHVNFDKFGKQFVSSSFDQTVILWDVETGQAKAMYSNRTTPYETKFYPLDNNLIISACQNHKLITWDIRTGTVVQEYNHHIGAVNTVTFVDEGRRFVSSSDDKKLLVWEWNMPVPITYISSPEQQSMPSITLHPSGSYFAAQSMDNRILVFETGEKTRPLRKKVFRGHVNTGYACQIGFSPNGQFMVSGDGQGKAFFWDWKTGKVFRNFQAHTGGPCMGAAWHPIENSRVATCGWDGLIKYWD
mmetsp:Transcript_6287/g.7230  ORF Transcript_6287/g.7230 Transcript_6287/m.7230 type:complete len:558 (+) Transcript_6287:133-1806(+)